MTAYVCFSVIPTLFVKSLGQKSKRFCIKAESCEEAREIASDVYSFDGVSHIKISDTKPKRKDLVELDKQHIVF